MSKGSSPRMRGTVGGVLAVAGAVGIIPAYAGNRKVWHLSHFHTRDHPRVCGEQLVSWLSRKLQQGSSPRMRGTVAAGTPSFSATRIIPAYAGNRIYMSCVSTSWRDHPRVCGEQNVAIRFVI